MFAAASVAVTSFSASVSSLYCMYCHASVPEQGGIPQQGSKVLTCQKADGMVALYWSPVISGCVIRNSAELPYLEEEERRPWGKLRLWQEFIIAFHPIYIDFVPICTRPPREETTPVDRMFTCPPDSRVLWGQKCLSDVVRLRRLVELKTNKDEQRNRSCCLNFGVVNEENETRKENFVTNKAEFNGTHVLNRSTKTKKNVLFFCRCPPGVVIHLLQQLGVCDHTWRWRPPSVCLSTGAFWRYWTARFSLMRSLKTH